MSNNARARGVNGGSFVDGGDMFFFQLAISGNDGETNYYPLFGLNQLAAVTGLDLPLPFPVIVRRIDALLYENTLDADTSVYTIQGSAVNIPGLTFTVDHADLAGTAYTTGNICVPIAAGTPVNWKVVTGGTNGTTSVNIQVTMQRVPR